MTKIIIIIVVSLVAVLVLLALLAPKQISVTTTQFIAAPKQQVFDQIRFMKNFPNWSPFLVQDPEQKYSISGPDGEVGATFHWEGVKEKSKGAQAVAALSGNDKVTLQCTITEPFQSKPVFDYTLVEKNGGVEVTQQFDTEMPIPANIFGLILGLKSKIAATNKQGLELLKKVSE